MQFKDVIGQRDFINKLIDMSAKGRFPHTQLYLGADGCQKLAVAIAYTQFINCEHPVYHNTPNADGLLGDSCGVCPSCKKINNLEHPDLKFYYPNNTGKKITKDSQSDDYAEEWREIIKETNADFSVSEWYNKIDISGKQGYINVRDLANILDTISFKNFSAKHRVMIFWMAETFYHDLETRLLKLFEEPANGTMFILICNDTSKLAGTTISRSQVFKFPKLKNNDIIEYLKNVFFQKMENTDIVGYLNNTQNEQLSVESITAMCNGDLTIARNLACSDNAYTYNRNKFMEWMRLLYKFSPHESMVFAKEIQSLGREKAKDFLATCLEELHYCLLFNSKETTHLNVSEELKNFLEKFAPFVTPDKMILLAKEIDTAIYHIERNCIISLIIMDLTIKIRLV